MTRQNMNSNIYPKYSKCPKNLYTKLSYIMAHANSADPDQTAPLGAVWSGSTLFAIPSSILRNYWIKSKMQAKVFEILEHLPYSKLQMDYFSAKKYWYFIYFSTNKYALDEEEFRFNGVSTHEGHLHQTYAVEK